MMELMPQSTLHLIPGQWGVKLCQVKLTVAIVEMGSTRTVTIVDSSDDVAKKVSSGGEKAHSKSIDLN